MIVGIGLDMVEVDRFGKKRHPRLDQRILTPRERALLGGSDGRRQEFLAGRFAVKEALAKAAGTGVGKRVGWQDIEVLPGRSGKPQVVLSPAARERIGWQTVRIHATITHSRQLVVAQVVVEEDSGE